MTVIAQPRLLQPPATLQHLVDAIPMLHVLVAPRGLSLHVRTTIVNDPIEVLAAEPDALLLLTNLHTDDPGAFDVVQRAASHGFCAFIMKARSETLTALADHAVRCGIAMLLVDNETPWRHLDGLLLTVIGAQRIDAGSTSAVGDELFTLANSIASVVGGSVAIEDLDRRILAYSSVSHQRIDSIREQGILARRVPEKASNSAQYRSVLASTGVLRFTQRADELPRAAVAIKAGERPLGTIWAIEATTGLDHDGELALLEGATLAALTMLRTHAATGVDPQVHEHALLGALEGSLPSQQILDRLALTGPAAVALIGFRAISHDALPTPLITHVASVLARYVAAYRPDAAMTTAARTVYVLLPGASRAGADRFATGALAAVHRAFPHSVRAAVARSFGGDTALTSLRREVDDVLQVTTATSGLPEVAHLGDVHTRVVLSRLAEQIRREPHLQHPGVIAMVEHDSLHATEYARTLGAWLDAVGDIAAAALSIGVHPNTLRYRLRKANELFDISLAHPDDRLSVWLQIRLALQPQQRS